MQNESFSNLFSSIVALGYFVEVNTLYNFFNLIIEKADMYVDSAFMSFSILMSFLLYMLFLLL